MDRRDNKKIKIKRTLFEFIGVLKLFYKYVRNINSKFYE